MGVAVLSQHLVGGSASLRMTPWVRLRVSNQGKHAGRCSCASITLLWTRWLSLWFRTLLGGFLASLSSDCFPIFSISHSLLNKKERQGIVSVVMWKHLCSETSGLSFLW